MKHPIQTVIFDFDGTIADTMDVLLDIYNNKLAPQFKCKPLKKEEKQRMRSMNPKEVMYSFGASKIKLPLMVLKARKELAKSIDSIIPHKGVCEVLRQLKEEKVRCGLLTSNSRSNVFRFLANHDLDTIFNFIYTGKHLFGKYHILRRIIRKERLSIKSTMYVGDEMRDIEAAQKVGIHVAAVTWGYNIKAALIKYSSDWIIEQPEELLDLV